MAIGDRLRGQPLAMLLLILGGWVALRVATWQPPHWEHPVVRAMTIKAPPKIAAAAGETPSAPRYAPVSVPVAYPYAGMPPVFWAGAGSGEGLPGRYAPPARPPRVAIAGAGGRLAQGAIGPYGDAAAGFARRDSHGWMAALDRLGATPRLAAYGGQSAPEAPAPVPMAPGAAWMHGDRWSADAWMLLRRETAPALASGRPVYGGSQAGAVLRYHLAPQSGYRPLAYLRASQALGGVSQTEAALGLGIRPLPALPLTIAAEGRAFRSLGKTEIRPAALAYTELPPLALPLGLRGEAYLQGGYVGGSFSTPFADGLLRVDHGLVSPGQSDLRLGGGIWGGAQKGARRLDIGPSAGARLDFAGVPARVSMDWRFRVMGDAEPKSGPAVTMSAGF